jgi:O-antigen ligase
MEWGRGIPFALFLLACLLLGGSSRDGHLANFVLQLGALGFLGWGLCRLECGSLGLPERLLLALTGLGVTIVALQAVPLPGTVWAALPGRAELASELQLLEVSPAPAFLTLSLHETIRSAVAVLPAIALGTALLASRQIPVLALACTLLAVSLLSICVGLAQFFGGSVSDWYFYDHTTRGSMVGFFANANHMATLLLVTLPFIAALVREGRARKPELAVELLVLGGALFAFVAIGIVLAGSLTGYALFVPVALASALIVWTPTRRLSTILAIPALAASAVLLVVSGDSQNVFSSEAKSSLTGREEIRRVTLPAAMDFFPAGTGLGTFEEVYRRYEDPASISRTFVNHAHNDYLELVMELGAPGLVLIALFAAWWLYTLRALTASSSSAFAWAAWIAIGVLLAHSTWDYPLRTAGLSTVLALSCVILARLSVPGRASPFEPARADRPWARQSSRSYGSDPEAGRTRGSRSKP